MPNPRRRERLSSLIEQVLSEVLLREVRDPRLSGLTSITGVEVTRDASQARVRVSVMGTEEEKQAAMKGLERATGFLRSRLGEEITIRHVPVLHFILDRSLEQGDKVIALLNSLDIPKETPQASSAAASADREDEDDEDDLEDEDDKDFDEDDEVLEDEDDLGDEDIVDDEDQDENAPEGTQVKGTQVKGIQVMGTGKGAGR